jgi:chromosome segregation ATPase
MKNKDAYAYHFYTNLDDWDAEIEKLKTKIETKETDKQAEFNKRLVQLQKKRNRVRKKMDELRKSGEEAWADLKSEFESLWESIEKQDETSESN